MIHFPSSRRYLHSVLLILAILVLGRYSFLSHSVPSFIFHQPPPASVGTRISIAKLKEQPLPPIDLFGNTPATHSWQRSLISGAPNGSSTSQQSTRNHNLDQLWKCPRHSNRYTNHIRLPAIIQNISQVPVGAKTTDPRVFWNPTVIALPYWSTNQYLVISRELTDGGHQQNFVCEANMCYVGELKNARKGERPCNSDDLVHVGQAGGLRCVTPPTSLSVPATPAKHCSGKFKNYVDIPGFHDPRLFYNGRGEPLMIVNTQSRYACFGLWLIDLRSIYPRLSQTLASSPRRLSLGPLTSYGHLTEITRNPSESRAPMEKNWFLFYPPSGESFVHYDISRLDNVTSGRTFGKLLGNGHTTVNLTDPLEPPCISHLEDSQPGAIRNKGRWHQCTNSLRLILCNRQSKKCKPTKDNTVFIAIVQRKHLNSLRLPMRYERYFMVWSAQAPYRMLGISKHPILLANETASGWEMWENWDDDPENAALVAKHGPRSGQWNSKDPYSGKGYWAYFTYTVSMAWAWGRPDTEVEGMGEGYLDDEVILSIGIDDKGQGIARVKAAELVSCLRACPVV